MFPITRSGQDLAMMLNPSSGGVGPVVMEARHLHSPVGAMGAHHRHMARSPSVVNGHHRRDMAPHSPKILQGLLYGYGGNGGDGPRRSSPVVHSPRASITPHRSSPVASEGVNTASYPSSLLQRARSTSLGSAGSSVRGDSRSPSHDSTASHDSFSRSSPLTITSSPSPSPPTPDHSSSKLFGLLKGTISTPYARLFNNRTHSPSSPSASASAAASWCRCAGCTSPMLPPARTHTLPAPSYKRPYSETTDAQDEPIDLSCKKSRSSGSEDAAENEEDGGDQGGSSSILESILCGRSHSDWAPVITQSSSSNRTRTSKSPIGGYSPVASPARQCWCNSTPKNSSNGSSSRSGSTDIASSRSPARVPFPPPPASPAGSESSVSSVSSYSTKHTITGSSRVALAKKNLFPVRARVSDWMSKIVDFCQSIKEFESLNSRDQACLLVGCWARLLLLFMAETNFQFAVSAVALGVDDKADEDGEALTVPSQALPTMQDVEKIQGFIKKCQSLGLDQHEYRCIRMATLFHSGSTGLEKPDVVEEVCTEVRRSLQLHVSQARPQEKMRYSSLLLCLHSLCGINTNTMETLFCQHLTKSASIQVLLNDLLQTDNT